MLSSLQEQADGKGTIAGSAIEDFLSIAGYETPGGGGGGGDGDFSTAEVTFINNSTAAGIQVICATAYDGEEGSASSTGLYAEVGDSDTQNVILYKGLAIGFATYEGIIDFSVTGDIELEGFDHFKITGSGTITATDNEGV